MARPHRSWPTTASGSTTRPTAPSRSCPRMGNGVHAVHARTCRRAEPAIVEADGGRAHGRCAPKPDRGPFRPVPLRQRLVAVRSDPSTGRAPRSSMHLFVLPPPSHALDLGPEWQRGDRRHSRGRSRSLSLRHRHGRLSDLPPVRLSARRARSRPRGPSGDQHRRARPRRRIPRGEPRRSRR